MKSITFMILMFLFSFSVFSNESAKDFIKKIDELYRSSGSVGKMDMEITTPNWKRVVEMDMWTKGMDYTFVRIRSPRKDRGVSSLKRKNQMWNFFPKINKVIKIPPSMMMGSWMGSDFTNDDLVKESSLIDDYKCNITGTAENTVVISLKPKKDTISLWGNIIVYIDKKNELPVKEEFYDEKGEKIRIMYFKDIKNFGKRKIPSKMELIPLKKEGHKTVVIYKEVKFDVDVPDHIFSITNLQKRRF